MESPVCRLKRTDLRGRDVDVVRAREVAGVGGAQEPEAVLKDFERAVAEDGLAFLGLGLEEGEDELLLAKAVGALELGGHLEELGDVFELQIGEIHVRRVGWVCRAGPRGMRGPGMAGELTWLRGALRNGVLRRGRGTSRQPKD